MLHQAIAFSYHPYFMAIYLFNIAVSLLGFLFNSPGNKTYNLFIYLFLRFMLKILKTVCAKSTYSKNTH